MSTKARKFEVQCTSFVPPNAGDIYQALNENYDIKYVGVCSKDGSICIYLYFENRLVYKNIVSVLQKEGFDVDADSIKVCTQFISDEIFTESGTKPRSRGPQKNKKRKSAEKPSIVNNDNRTINNDNSTTINNNNNNINVIIVNPIGMESTEHITPEFIQELLAEHHGPDVVFRFGTKMYSLQENMNFKTDLKSGYISGRLEQDGSWETHRKQEGFSMLLDNLKDKNEQAVLRHLETIPNEDLKKFELDMGWIREHKISGLQEDEPVYNKFIREGFNLLTANIADKKRRIERDTGKKMRLV
jgi:hypothetical protein